MNLDARSAALLLPLFVLPATAAQDDATHDAPEDPRVELPAADTAGERPGDARRRELAVNLFLCANALPGCDPTLLTGEQRQRFLENRPPPR